MRAEETRQLKRQHMMGEARRRHWREEKYIQGSADEI